MVALEGRHTQEVQIDAALVRALLPGQFRYYGASYPEFVALALRTVERLLSDRK